MQRHLRLDIRLARMSVSLGASTSRKIRTTCTYCTLEEGMYNRYTTCRWGSRLMMRLDRIGCQVALHMYCSLHTTRDQKSTLLKSSLEGAAKLQLWVVDVGTVLATMSVRSAPEAQKRSGLNNDQWSYFLVRALGLNQVSCCCTDSSYLRNYEYTLPIYLQQRCR